MDPISEIFICFGLEEYFEGHPEGSDPKGFDIIDHVLNPEANSLTPAEERDADDIIKKRRL